MYYTESLFYFPKLVNDVELLEPFTMKLSLKFGRSFWFDSANSLLETKILVIGEYILLLLSFSMVLL